MRAASLAANARQGHKGDGVLGVRPSLPPVPSILPLVHSGVAFNGSENLDTRRVGRRKTRRRERRAAGGCEERERRL